MPIDTIAESFLGGILRFIGWVFVDVILEVLVKGMGSLVQYEMLLKEGDVSSMK